MRNILNMSRIGRKPIPIPQDVEVKIEDSKVIVKGPKGELSQEIRPEVKVEIREGNIFVSSQKSTSNTPAFWGLTRALIFNIVKGVREGFEKKLALEGIGYRARLEGKDLVLEIGFSHPVKIKTLQGIDFKVEKNIITVFGIDKQKVGDIAAQIRAIRKPEPYKGKGIHYLGEVIRRKPGKKAITTE